MDTKPLRMGWIVQRKKTISRRGISGDAFLALFGPRPDLARTLLAELPQSARAGSGVPKVFSALFKAAENKPKEHVAVELEITSTTAPSYCSRIQNVFDLLKTIQGEPCSITVGWEQLESGSVKFFLYQADNTPHRTFRQLDAIREKYSGSVVVMLVTFGKPTADIDNDADWEGRVSAYESILAEIKATGGEVLPTADESLFAYFLPDHRGTAAVALEVLRAARRIQDMLGSLQLTIACDLLKNIRLCRTQYGGFLIGWPKERSQVERLAMLDFEQAHACNLKHGGPLLLLTEAVRRETSHVAFCEPVGLLALRYQDQQSSAAVWRLWFLDEISERCVSSAQVEHFVEDLEEKKSGVHGRIAVSNDWEGRQVSRALLFFLQQRPRKPASESHLVLHWECHDRRSEDLLGPVTESLRDLFGVNCRAPSFDAVAHIDALLEPYNLEPEAVQRLVNLLLGSVKERDFSQVTEDLLRLSQKYQAQMTIVVENFQHADELTIRLVKGLIRNQIPNSRIRLLIVSKSDLEDPLYSKLFPIELSTMSSDDVACVEHALADLRKDERLLCAAKVAATLGWEFLRSWWMHILKQRPETKGHHDEIVALLLRRGILKYSGCHRDVADRTRKYRDLKFCSVSLYQRLRQETDALLRKDVYLTFLQALRDNQHLKVDGKLDVGRVRCKLRLCGLVRDAWDEFGPLELIQELCEPLMELFWIVGKRAFDAQEYQEANRRLKLAHRILTLMRGNFGYESALRVLAHLVAVSDGNGEEYVDSATDLHRQINVPNKLESSIDRSFFELDRTIWSWRQSYGSVETACTAARVLHADWNALTHSKSEFIGGIRKLDLLIESYHTQAVSNFYFGSLKEATDCALNGKSVCENANEVRKYDNSLCFGSHDGAACCKVFLALALLLRQESFKQGKSPPITARSIIDVAIRYTFGDEQAGQLPLDELTRLIIGSYVGLFFILEGDFDRASEQLGRFAVSRANVSGRWRLFRELMIACAQIGSQWAVAKEGRPINESSVQDNCNKLKSLRERYKPKDGVPIWASFSALGCWLLNDRAGASTHFQEALAMVDERKERFFAPEIFRFQAWCLQDSGQPELASEALENRRESARSMGAKLYLDAEVI